MEQLRLTSKESLKIQLKARDRYKYDQADYLIDQAEYLFQFRISDKVVFRNLIPATYVIKKDEAPRNLDEIVARIKREVGGLDRLIETQPCQTREWYERIRTLYQGFEWAPMGPVFITPVKGSRQKGINQGCELGPTPKASFMIVSGLHCSLAALLRIHEGKEKYQPVEAVLVLPRVDY